MSTVLFHILLAGALGTTVMTLFTYLVEKVAVKDLGEPKYLNRLVCRSRRFEAEPGDGHITGWAIHYAIGFFFAAGMVAFRSVTGIYLTPLIGVYAGAVFGILGIVGWTVMFAIHHDPPKIDFRVFGVQLLAAHILFGATVALYFRIVGV